MKFKHNSHRLERSQDKSQSSNRGHKPGYLVVPFSSKRQMVAAVGNAARRQNNIHALIEVDITEPRRIIQAHRRRTGEKLSLTAYVIACLARAVAEHPHLNAFRKGRKLILLDDVTIGALVEREFEGELVPESFGIQAAQDKTYRQIHDQIRSVQQRDAVEFGGLSGTGWIRFIPGFLLETFVRLASRSITMMARYGAVYVSAVGMYANDSFSLIPLTGGATVGVTVGGIVKRPAVVEDRVEVREYLNLTVTFNHDIVDGAPAARFVKRFSELLQAGELLLEAAGQSDDQPGQACCLDMETLKYVQA